jgi:hypothetical protein
MSYFRADAQMIAKLIAKDCLRFNAENLASLLVIMQIESSAGVQPIATVIYGDDAEELERNASLGQYYDIQGALNSHSPNFEEYQLPKLSVRVRSINPVPTAQGTEFYCEVLGRLTSEPDKVSKTDGFEFSRFSLAVNRSSTDKPNFFNFSVFKPKLTERMLTLKKGQTLFAAGELSFFKKGTDGIPGWAIKLERAVSFK